MIKKIQPSTDNTTSHGQQTDVWVSWAWVWSAFFYLLLIMPLALTLRNDEIAAVQLPWLIGLSVLFGLAHWVGAIYLPHRIPDIRRRPSILLIYIITLVIIWIFLVRIDPVFFAAIGGIFCQIYFWLPPRWSIISTVVLMIYLALQDAAGSGWFGREIWWIWFILTIAAAFLGLWIHAIINQSEQRKRLIQQLEDAQGELAAAERRAGMLNERQRLAHEIHDTLAQGFISIVTHLEAAEQALPLDVPVVARHLEQARQTARDSLTQARRVVQALRPEPLVEATLAQAIQRVVAGWTSENGIPAHATVTGDPQALHPNIEVHLLRAAQEALTNVRKHANASQVAVTLSYMPDLIVLDIQDNGVGINGSSVKRTAENKGGYGLIAMNERIEQLGGQVSLESEPGEGTTVAIQVPLVGEMQDE